MNYNSWCNDKPLKIILRDILELNGWNVSPKEIQIKISEDSLISTKQFLDSRNFKLNPKLKQFKDVIYNIDSQIESSKLSDLIPRKARPDLICYKDNTLMVIENKSRLFVKIQKEIKKKDVMPYFDDYFIRYHFDDPYLALNAFRDLMIFKFNMKKSINSRINEDTRQISSDSCEMFRHCAALNNLDNYSKIFQNLDLPVQKIVNRIAVIMIPFYIDPSQKQVLIECISRLQNFCDLHLSSKIHLQIWEIRPENPETILDFYSTNKDGINNNKNNGEIILGDPDGFYLSQIPFSNISNNIKTFQQKIYSFDFSNTNFLEKNKLVTEKTAWRSCVECNYFRKFGKNKLESLKRD